MVIIAALKSIIIPTLYHHGVAVFDCLFPHEIGVFTGFETKKFENITHFFNWRLEVGFQK